MNYRFRFVPASLLAFVLSMLESLAEEELILGTASTDWSYLYPVDKANSGFDPALSDPDFHTTWFDPTGQYLGGAPYDGPAFQAGANAPFYHEPIPGFPADGTEIPLPLPDSRGTLYLLKEIDGGAEGFRDLRFNIWAFDGCYVYLNGKLVATVNVDADVPDSWDGLAPFRLSSFYEFALPAAQNWLEPGPNLLAISVHNDDLEDAKLGVSLQIYAEPGPPVPVTVSRQPYLQMATPDSMTICWRTRHHADSTVHFWSDPAAVPITVSDDKLTIDHKVKLTGLLPDTRYHYAVSSEDIFGTTTTAGGEEDHWFRTAPVPGSAKPTTIWVIGDSGSAGHGNEDPRSRSVFDGYLAYNENTSPDVWLMLGDNAYGSGTDEQYQFAVFEVYTEILKNTALWPTQGNHDRRNSPTFASIFELPAAGEAGGMPSGSEFYYSFDHGDIHFICLDSANGNHVNPEVSTAMYDWLEADLASTDQEWIIAYFHHGPYTKGSHNSDFEITHFWTRENAIPILEAYGVDLVLSGHSHAYERSMLVNGHYGLSTTFDPVTMTVDGGNGSDFGSVDEEGDFLTGLGMSGAYQKPAGTGNAGAVYSTVGCSGLTSFWSSGSREVVNPEPHPVMLVNLLMLGSMVIEVEGNCLNARFLDQEGNIRDDFTLLKGATVSIDAVDGVFVETGSNDTATIRFKRTGATSLPLEAEFSLSGTAGLTVDYSTADPIGGILPFAPGQTERDVVLRRIPDDEEEGWETVGFLLKPSPHYRIAEPNETVTAFLGESSYAGWTLGHFGFGSPGIDSSPDGDPDFDGWTNLMEYALGGLPLAADSDTGPQVVALWPFLGLDYIRDTGKPDLNYIVEASTDLSEWTVAPVIKGIRLPAGPDGMEARRDFVVDDGAGEVYRFLRLRVELIP